MKRPILRRIAVVVAMALFLPMAGVTETLSVEAALTDDAVYEAEMALTEENAAEEEVATEPTDDAAEAEPAVGEADELDLSTDEDGDIPEGGDEENPNAAAEPERDGEGSELPGDTPASQEEPEQDTPAQEDSAEDAAQEPEAVSDPAEGDEAERPAEESAAEAPEEEAQPEKDAPVEADAAAREAAPADAAEVELIQAEAEQPKLTAAPAVPAALTLGVKEKYSLAGMGDGFTTSNKKVAAVNAAGLVTAKKKGTAIITVTAGGSPVGTCQLTVKAAPKKIKLPKKQSVVVGQSIILTPTLSGGYSGTITWTSSNPAVATVDAGGFVTAVGMGKAKITARTHNKKKAVCAVTVDSPNAPTSVAFPMGTLYIGKGESVQLRPVLNPGAEATFTYTSKNKKVASVGKATGVVKGKKLKKSTKITVKTQNGRKAALTVKVLKPATEIALNAGAVTLDVGGVAGLAATLPANTASQVTWTSSNPGVAVVSEVNPFTAGNGSGITVTAVGAGSAVITASTFNGKTAACQVTVNAPAPAPVSVPAPTSTPVPVPTAAPELAAPSFSLSDTSPAQGEDMIVDLSGASAGSGESHRAVLRDGAGAVVGEYDWDSETRTIAIPTGELPTGDYSLSVTVSAPGYPDKTVDAGEIAVAASETLVAPIYALDRDACRQGEAVTVTIKNADQGKGERYWVYITSESDDTYSYTGEGLGEIRVQLGDVDAPCPTGRYAVRVVARAEGYDDAQSAGSGTLTVRSATLEDISYTLDPGDTVERGKPLTIHITTPDQGVGERYSAALLKDDSAVAASVGDSRTLTIDTRRAARGVYALRITASADGFADVTTDATITVTSLFDMENGVITGYNGPGGAVTIPDTDYEGNPITAIGAGAFGNGSGVTQAIFPAAAAASIGSIADDAFEGCEDLSVVAPKDTYAHVWAVDNGYAEAEADNLGDFVFEVAADGTATVVSYNGEGGDVTVPGMDAEGHPVVAIGKMAFRYNENIVHLTLPATLRSIGEMAFASCGALERCDIPVGVTEIGKRAFEYCGSLVSCDIPESVTTLGDWAFYRCEALSPVIRSENVLVAGSSGYMPFIGCARYPSVPKLDCATARTLSRAMTGFTVEGVPCVSLGYTFDESGAETGVTASQYQVQDTETLVIPEGVTSIPYSDFSSLPAEVREVVIPNTVTDIGDYAFSYCYGLETVTIPDSVKRVGKQAFRACRALTEAVIGDGVEEIGDQAFDRCEKLTAVTLGSGLRRIGKDAFNNDRRTALAKLDIGSLESWLTLETDADYGGLYLREKTLYIDGQPASEISVPQGIAEINDKAFMNFTNLRAVTLSDSVKRVGNSAFYGCPALETVSGGNGLESLDVRAFYSCKKLKSIDLGENLREIGTSAFSGCSSLTEIRIPDGVTTVGSQAFYSCASLKSVYIGGGVESIMAEAFSGCLSLSELHIYSLESWLRISFDKTSYGAAYYSSHPNVYASDWYVGDEPLTEIVVPDSITEISDYAFYNCRSATSVTLHDDVASVGERAFEQCGGVPYVRVQSLDSASGRSLGRAGLAFVPNDCPALAFKYAFAEDAETGLSVVALADASATRVEIPAGATDIVNTAFLDCTDLVSVAVAETVTDIGNRAFSGCTALERVEGMAGVTSIGYSAFEKCAALREVALSDGLTSIGYRAFLDCTGLLGLRVPDSVTSMGYSPFRYDALLRVSALDCPAAHLLSKAGYNFVPDTSPTLSFRYVYKNDEVTGLAAKESLDKSATEIELPDGVTKTDSPGFQDCASLAIIRVPNSIQEFNYSYYPSGAALYVEAYDCAAAMTLSKLNRNFTTPDAPMLRLRHTLKDGVSTALNVVSGVNTGIESAVIPDYVTGISIGAFKSHTRLESVRIGSGVTAIPANAFGGCSQLTTVEIVGSVTSIGQNAFSGCTALPSMTIPGSVTTLDSDAFSGCTGLRSVQIMNGVKTIGGNAFLGCTALSSVTIPDSVTSLGEYAFSGCASLTTAVIGGGVKTISSYAFSDCTSLTSVVIPASVSTIYSTAFSGCTALKTIYGTKGSRAESLANSKGCTFVDLSNLGSDDPQLDAVVPKTVTLGVGQNYWPTDILAYATAYNIAYSSGNSAVVAIENSQWVAKQMGRATIITTFTGKGDPTQVIARQTEVTVGMRVAPQAVTLEPGQQKALSVYFDGMSATTGEWISDNTRVATVSEDGKVTGVKPGTATITYRVDSDNAGYESWIESFCTVTVINNPGLTLEIGEDELVDYNVTRVNMKLTVDASEIEAVDGQEVVYGAPRITFEMPHAIEACVPKASDDATVDYTLSGGVASLAVPSLAGRSGSVDVSFEFTYAVTEDEAADFKEPFTFNVSITGADNSGDAYAHEVAFGYGSQGYTDDQIDAMYVKRLKELTQQGESPADDAQIRSLVYHKLVSKFDKEKIKTGHGFASDVLEALRNAPEAFSSAYLYAFSKYKVEVEFIMGPSGYFDPNKDTMHMEFMKYNDWSTPSYRLSALTLWFHESGHALDHYAGKGRSVYYTDNYESALRTKLESAVTEMLRDWMATYRAEHPGEIPDDDAAEKIIQAILDPRNKDTVVTSASLITVKAPENLESGYESAYTNFVTYSCARLYNAINQPYDDRGEIFKESDTMLSDMICGVTNCLIHGGNGGGHGGGFENGKPEYWFKSSLLGSYEWTNSQSHEAFAEYCSSVFLRQSVPEVYNSNREHYKEVCDAFDKTIIYEMRNNLSPIQ